MKCRHPRPLLVLGSLLFATDVSCWWRHADVIAALARRHRMRLGLVWGLLEALAGWEGGKPAPARPLVLPALLAVLLAAIVALRVLP